jgi:hypothetical protein
MVHFTRSGVIHMGDLQLSQSFPAVGRNVPQYMDFLERAIDIFPQDTIFVGGHGKDLDFQGLNRYREMLTDTIAIVRAQMKKGKTPDQMKTEKILDKYKSYNTFLVWLDTGYWIGAVYSAYRPKK